MRKAALLPLLPLLLATACVPSDSEALDRDEAVDLVVAELVDDTHPLIMFASDDPLPAGTRVSAPSSVAEDGDDPESVVLDEPAWLVWIDDEPGALFGHDSRVVLVDADDGELTVIDASWWPMVDDERVFTDEGYADPGSWVYSIGYSEDGFRDGVLPEPDPAAACEGPKRGKALVLNGWQRGETVENDFAANGTQMNTLLESVGLDTTYLAPDGTADADGYASAETIVPYFMQLERDLKPGDDFVLYITGHGRKSDGTGQSRVGPWWERDVERWLSRLDPGVNVIVIFDGCHSGTTADSLSCVADLVITSTDQRSAWGDLDTPAWYDKLFTNVRDINDADVGTEWTSSFVAGWNEIVGDEAKLDDVEMTAQSEGGSFVQELVESAFDAAHQYDAAEKAGRTTPQITPGAAKTKPGGVTYHTEGLACAMDPTDPTDPTGCTLPGGTAESVGQMFGLAPDDPAVSAVVCEYAMDLPTGNEVLYSDGVQTGTAAGAVDFDGFGGVRLVELPGTTDLACGPGPNSLVLCGNATPPPGTEFVLTWFTVDAPLQLENNQMYTQLSVVFDADGDPTNDYVPPEQWRGDYWAGADLAIEIAHAPDFGWDMRVLDMAKGFVQVDLGVRIVMQGNAVAVAVPMDAFTVANPGARISAFEHTGDWGQSGPWSGDVYPVVGDPLFQFPRY